jgi:hypothetical protein
MFQPLLFRQRLQQKNSAWASDGAAGGRPLAGEQQLGRSASEQSRYCQLYMHSGEVSLAAKYLRRVRVASRNFAAALLAHVSTIVTTPVPAAQNLGVGFRRRCRGQTFNRRRKLGKCAAEQSKYEHSEQALAPHTNGPRDVPRCGALSLLQKTLKTRFNSNPNGTEANDASRSVRAWRGSQNLS